MNNSPERRSAGNNNFAKNLAHQLTTERAKKVRELAKSSKELENLMIDRLTGLPSGIALDHLIENFNFSDYASDTIFFCVYIDIKGVKKINDLINHEAGDFYLKHCAEVLSNCFRIKNGQDILVRDSKESKPGLHRKHATGDEFVVLLTCPKFNSGIVPTAISQRLNEVLDNSDGISFRYGISSSPNPNTANIDNKAFFKHLINQADENLNSKRKMETKSDFR